MYIERADKPEVSLRHIMRLTMSTAPPKWRCPLLMLSNIKVCSRKKNDLFGSSFLMNGSESYICSSEMGSLAKMPWEKGTEVIGEWTLLEKCKSSTWHETEAVSRVIQSNVDILKDSSVKVFF